MKLTIKKKHNEPVEVFENGKEISVQKLVIEGFVGDVKDLLKVRITNSSDLTRTFNNNHQDDEIDLNMGFGGGYGLHTEDNCPILSYSGSLLGRVQSFKYELDAQETTMGNINIRIALT